LIPELILESLTKSLAEQGLHAVLSSQIEETRVPKAKRHQKHWLAPRSWGLIPQIALLACILFVVTPNAGAAIHFDREVRPILSEYCFPCHGPDAEQRKADLRLDTKEGLFGASGEQGPVVPGNPDLSQLITRVLSSDLDERMPPPKANHPLSGGQIEILQQWVREGAQWQQHWAFEPIKNPPIDMSPVSKWTRNEVDTFIQRRHREAGLEPADEASREELVRRLSLDLHGLPPTPEAISQFVNDPRPDAYIRLLDRLFGSPRYGERMVWNWLDAARYADSNGYQGDRERTMWPWRDWATQELNRNTPFDQFTIDQLAGDLLPNPTKEQILATGFNRNHMINGEGGRIPEENRIDYVMDMSETMGTVWLGLTVNCCRCHDHKFDPISQRDYYGLFAFFNQTPVTGGGGDPQTPPILELPAPKTIKRQEQIESKQLTLEDLIRKTELSKSKAIQTTNDPDKTKPIFDSDIAKRKDTELDTLIKAVSEEHPEYLANLKQLKKVRQQLSSIRKQIPKVMVMRDQTELRDSFILTRGLYNKPGTKVTAATPPSLPPMPVNSPKNRLGLAQWLVSRDNPLTARVFVNRQWAMFLGQGLVTTPEDFGTQGSRPTHPALLDWLASDFIDSGWDIKRLQRRILLSATYRQTSRVTPEKLEIDPENKMYSRGPRYRLPSWMIRDQALAASGLLVGHIGGPPVKPYQPEGVWADFSFGNKRYQPDTGAALYRRSLYTFWRRIIGPTMFFDASRRQSCVVKSARTNTPLHALATLNDVTYIEAARALAERALNASRDPRERITHAFQWATGRVPNHDEINILMTRLERSIEAFSQAPSEAASLLAEGASKPGTDLNPVEHAAYTNICNLILNLDETLSKQ
jgi:hypothetical protein